MELARRAEQMLMVRVIRRGLVSMIPVLLAGAFALVFKSFPVEGYQNFIAGFADGFLLKLFDMAYLGTFGLLAVYMNVFISAAYMRVKADPDVPLMGAIVTSLISFFILTGVSSPAFGLDSLGPKSMFMAILTGVGSSALYFRLYTSEFNVKYKILTRGADRDFNRMLSTLGPIVFVTVLFALFNALIVELFKVNSFHEMLINILNGLFSFGETGFWKGLFFVLFSSVMWFFGIHGSNVLEGVMQEYFVPGLAENQAAMAMGAEPANILTKQFFDCFVFMGGCGTMICLLISILLFSRVESRRRLGTAAALPMLFNINELMVFGLPIIYNPIMLIPFILTPLACYTMAYLAFAGGFVPLIIGNVEWTTPVFIGGYIATGSNAGSLLQLLNIVIGVIIYTPFVRILDGRTKAETQKIFEEFVQFFKENEEALMGRTLIYQQDIYGEFARNLTAELKKDMKEGISMHYQPQFNYSGDCEGVEALLRWEHPVYGVIYPPLTIKLAEEGGFLPDLEEDIMLRVLEESDKIREEYGKSVKISINITGTTVVTERFLEFCRKINEEKPFMGRNICLEVTEQATLYFTESTVETLKQLRAMGLWLAIDDFSMGHTSIAYLKHNLFDVIKLDGSLVKGLFDQENCEEIIASILKLADSLHIKVIAEYVETEEQRDTLKNIGCDCYQGWLYSPAKPVE